MKRRACARSEVGYGLAAKQTERSGDLRSQKADHNLAAERSGAIYRSARIREPGNATHTAVRQPLTACGKAGAEHSL